MDYRITDAIAKYDMLSFHDDIDKRSGTIGINGAL